MVPMPSSDGAAGRARLDGSDLGHFAGCRVAATVTNAAGVNNDERGTPVDLCACTRAPWSQIWASLRHLD